VFKSSIKDQVSPKLIDDEVVCLYRNGVVNISKQPNKIIIKVAHTVHNGTIICGIDIKSVEGQVTLLKAIHSTDGSGKHACCLAERAGL
jgi:hypothetical protein